MLRSNVSSINAAIGNEQEAVLAAMMDTSFDAVICEATSGTIASWNNVAERLFGYSAVEAINQSITLIIPPEKHAEERYIMGQLLQGKKVEHFETFRVTKDGHQLPVALNASPIFSKDGVIVGAIKVIRNISEARSANEKQAVLAAIVATSDDAIVSKTLKGIITSWNRAAEIIFGYTEAEAVGQHISLIIPPERLNEETYIIGEVSRGNKVDHFETVRVTKDGKLIPISLTVSPILDENGKIIGASKIARDISEHLAIQQEKARLYDEIKALNEKKDEFIGLASHELKTPLTSVQGYLQILNNDMSEDRRKEFLRRTGQQVKKLNNLVSDLLDISKIEAGKLQFNPAPFDICQLTRDAIDLMAYSNQSYRIELLTSLTTLMVDGDGQRIEQVILNLLTNAIRYSPQSVDIEVTLSLENNMAKISVRDQGIGIPADKIEHIFCRFYRIQENRNVSGLGIGLYLAKQIIERHNGQIWAESTPGKGSVFYFTIPIENV